MLQQIKNKLYSDITICFNDTKIKSHILYSNLQEKKYFDYYACSIRKIKLAFKSIQ